MRYYKNTLVCILVPKEKNSTAIFQQKYYFGVDFVCTQNNISIMEVGQMQRNIKVSDEHEERT